MNKFEPEIIKSPKLAEFLLSISLDISEREFLLGDLEESYNLILRRDSRIKAWCWYWWQTLKLSIVYIYFSLLWGGEMFSNNIKVTIRNLRQHKSFALINIFGLAVGIAAFIMIALFDQYELTWDTHNENYDRIYRVQSIVDVENGTQYWTQTPIPVAEHLRNNFPEFEKTAVMRETWGIFLSAKDGVDFAEGTGYYSSPEVFDIFTIDIIKGEKENLLSEPYSIVLTEKYVDKYFAGEDPVGEIMKLSNKHTLKVTGVIKDFPENSHIQPNFFISFSTLEKLNGRDYVENWFNNSFRNYVLLSENQDPDDVNPKIANVIKQFDPNINKELYLRPLSVLHINPDHNPDHESIIYYYGGLAIFTLLLACINFINLTTAYSTMRAKEIGVRKVVGSSRMGLIKQFLSETFVICFISTVIAFILAEFGLPLFNDAIYRNLEIDYFGNWEFVVFIFAVMLVVSLLSGAYPAFYLSGFKPVSVLKGDSFSSVNLKGKGKLRKVLVTFQFIISLTLILSTVYIVQHIDFLRNKDVGFNRYDMLYANIDQQEEIDFESLRSELLSIPGIVNVTNSYNVPFHGSSGREINWEGAKADERMNTRFNRVNYEFINTFEMEIVKGRDFSKSHSTDSAACILNETAVEIIGWEDPIGKRVWDNKYTVIGIVKDYHFWSVHDKIHPGILLLNNGQNLYSNDFTFRVEKGQSAAVLPLLNTKLKEVFPDIPFELNYFDHNFNFGTLRIWNSVGNTFKFFALIAILIAAVGLFALVSFAVKRRTKEIGIRKVLGATVNNIYLLVSKEFILIMIIAIIISLPLGYVMSVTTPGAYKYQMTLWDYLIPSIAVIFLAFLVTAYQSISAALDNPSNSLRDE